MDKSSSDPQENKRLVRAFMMLMNVEKRVDEAIDTYLTPGFIEHDPSSGSGREAIRAFFKDFFRQYPQAQLEAKRMIADGDLVAVHFHGKTHPSDRGIAGVEIFRIENGKLAEHWQVTQEIPERSLNENGIF